jgi:hypothetical protein
MVEASAPASSSGAPSAGGVFSASTASQFDSPPMIDATKLNPTRVPSLTKRERSHQSITMIEGMEQLEKPIMMLEGGESGSGGEQLTEAEKRMREEELSFYSASDNDHGDDNIWGLLSGVGGNIYEWYVRLNAHLDNFMIHAKHVDHT